MKTALKIFIGLLLIVIVLTALSIGFFFFWKTAQNGQYDVNLSQSPPHLEAPITTEREAILQAINYGLTREENFASKEERVILPEEWSLTARQTNKHWEVVLKTKKFTPSYQCVMLIDENAKMIEDQGCSWNK